MSLSVKSSNVGYTNQGNPYQKSKVGKNVGTAVGLGMLIPATKHAAKKSGLSLAQVVEKCSKFIKSGPAIGDYISLPEKFDKLLNFLGKHKSARVATIATFLALPVMLYAGTGRLLGHGVDKLIDSGAKKQADIDAKSQKA